MSVYHGHASDRLELELQAVVSHHVALGIELRPSGRATRQVVLTDESYLQVSKCIFVCREVDVEVSVCVCMWGGCLFIPPPPHVQETGDKAKGLAPGLYQLSHPTSLCLLVCETGWNSECSPCFL